MVSRRTAYWRPEIKERLLRGGGRNRRRCAVAEQGVWIAAVWRFPPTPQHPPAANPVEIPTSRVLESADLKPLLPERIRKSSPFPLAAAPTIRRMFSE